MVDSDTQQSSSRELITVGIPCYNRREPTRRAVLSVLGQNYRPLRLVVSDNASDDGTPDMLRDLAGDHEQLVPLLRDANSGPTANFQGLRDHVNGGYFMWLGDDDWLGEGALESCAQALDEDPDLVLAAPTTWYHGPEGAWMERPSVELLDDDPRRRVLQYYRQVSANGVFEGLARTSAVRSLPPVSNDMGGDWFHVAAMAFLGKVRTIDAVVLNRSVGGATTSLSSVARHLGLGWVARNAPQISIAWHTFADIGWESPVYASLTRFGRLRLGARAAGIILRRFLPGAIAKFIRLQWRALWGRLRSSAGRRAAAS